MFWYRKAYLVALSGPFEYLLLHCNRSRATACLPSLIFHADCGSIKGTAGFLQKTAPNIIFSGGDIRITQQTKSPPTVTESMLCKTLNRVRVNSNSHSFFQSVMNLGIQCHLAPSAYVTVQGRERSGGLWLVQF